MVNVLDTITPYLLTLLLGAFIGFLLKHKFIVSFLLLLSFITGVSLFQINISAVISTLQEVYTTITNPGELLAHTIVFTIGLYTGSRTQRSKIKVKENVLILRDPFIEKNDY